MLYRFFCCLPGLPAVQIQLFKVRNPPGFGLQYPAVVIDCILIKKSDLQHCGIGESDCAGKD